MGKIGHLVIACGGTGGHFYPTLAVAREYVARGGKVTLLVSGRHAAEQHAIAEQWGFAAREIETVRAPSGLRELLAFPFRLWRCCRRAKAVLKELDGDVLLGMGSFAAVPPCWVWPWRRKALVLHEGNTVMGRTNRLFAGHARGIALSLPLKDERQLKGAPARITGMPLRDAVLTAAAHPLSEAERAAALEGMGLSAARRTVLVFGGSQGARAINQLLTATAARLASERDRLQFILLTGTDDNAEMEAAFREAGISACIRRADPDIQRCYQVADLVVCRSGASSICELALFGLPMVLLPLPSAADNHQYFNAQALVAEGAAVCRMPSDYSPEWLAEFLCTRLADLDRLREMGAKARVFAHPDATTKVTDLIVDSTF